MTVYAKNKDAVAICNRSGQKMMRADMIEDGYLRGLLVHPDWYDPYHPQERPFDPDEGIAIYRPAPDLVPIPPGPSLLIHSVAGGAPGFTNVSLAITQPNPPASTVTRWELWRAPLVATGTPVFQRVAFQLPTAPQFIPVADLVQQEALNQVPANTVINSSIIGQQFATITDTTAVTGNSYFYYVVTDTADTSNTQSPNQFPNGLQSAPTYVNALGQTTSAPIVLGNPATTPKTQVALQSVFIAGYSPGGGSTHYFYSPDGFSWTQGTFPVTVSGCQAAFGGVTNKLWVQMTGTQTPLTSPDGITWTQRTNAMPSAFNWFGVAWSPTLNLFAACINNANSGNQIATSPDGITWTQRSTPAGPFLTQNVYWSPRLKLFLAMLNGGGTNVALTSPDGINWTLRTSNASIIGPYFYDFGSNFQYIAWGPGAVSHGASVDGITWTQANNTNIGGSNTGAAPFQPISDLTHVYITAFSSLETVYKSAPADPTLVGTWVSTGVTFGGATTGQGQNSVYSPALNIWVIVNGAINNNMAWTTSDAVHFSLAVLSTTAGASLASLAVAA